MIENQKSTNFMQQQPKIYKKKESEKREIIITYGDSRFARVLVLEVRTQGRDVEVLVAIRAREVGSDLVFNLEIIDAQPI